MSYSRFVAGQVIGILSTALVKQAEMRTIRIGRDAGKTHVFDWMVPSASLSPRDNYQAPARLKGAAKDKRASKKAKNKKRGRK